MKIMQNCSAEFNFKTLIRKMLVDIETYLRCHAEGIDACTQWNLKIISLSGFSFKCIYSGYKLIAVWDVKTDILYVLGSKLSEQVQNDLTCFVSDSQISTIIYLDRKGV